MPSGAWYTYRRIVGGTRVLLSEGSPRLLLRRDDVRANRDDLVESASTWEGVDPRPHRNGGTEFVLDGREIGHVHEWGLLDIPFLRPIGDAVVESGIAARHHILAKTGWVATIVETAADRERGLALLRLSYLWHATNYDPPELDLDRNGALERVSALDLDDRVLEAFEETARRHST